MTLIRKSSPFPCGLQALSLRISSASTHSARFRLTLRSMLPTARVCTLRPCTERPCWPPRRVSSWISAARHRAWRVAGVAIWPARSKQSAASRAKHRSVRQAGSFTRSVKEASPRSPGTGTGRGRKPPAQLARLGCRTSRWRQQLDHCTSESTGEALRFGVRRHHLRPSAVGNWESVRKMAPVNRRSAERYALAR